MSDGLTDANRSTQAAERRCMLLRSVVECLEGWDDETKRQTAANDVVAFYQALVNLNAGLDRETGALMFLDSLRTQYPQSWAVLLAFALKYGTASEVDALKNLSPFRGKTLVIMPTKRLNLADDLMRTLRDQVDDLETFDDDAPVLVVLDLHVESAFNLRY
ncbi:hypothetical protein HZC53_06270 [Candidatus Uhrbacteria bacterium]|nr:hypothetical protein [Candidatus Uhrbacteria bacterium]